MAKAKKCKMVGTGMKLVRVEFIMRVCEGLSPEAVETMMAAMLSNVGMSEGTQKSVRATELSRTS